MKMDDLKVLFIIVVMILIIVFSSGCAYHSEVKADGSTILHIGFNEFSEGKEFSIVKF